MQRAIYLGYDSRETEAFVIARRSMRRYAPVVPIDAIEIDDMRDLGLYTRPTTTRINDQGVAQLWDNISEAPMSTEFAITRFLTPHLAKTGIALFADCDVLARAPLDELFCQFDPKYAVMCVKHSYDVKNTVKMDGQEQQRYARKNWSSVVLFNCDHAANQALTVDMINTVPGRDLHRFCWLKDKQIGEIGTEWNWLAGVSDPKIEPKLIHFTNGGPWLPAYRHTPHAGEWLAERRGWLEEEKAIAGRPSTWKSKFNGAGDAAHL